MSQVLVTGGSGFLASHCILRLLAYGHTVHATLRDPTKAHALRDALTASGAGRAEELNVHVADLMDDTGWQKAVANCDYVLHVASPFPASAPTDEDALIRPAREGTLRVLRAARDAGVKRVVMTSSFGAIGYGHPPRARPCDERDWTDIEGPGVSSYIKSKTLAERAAWDFMAQEGGPLELSVINPAGMFGPLVGLHCAASVTIIQQMLAGAMPVVPRIHFGVVDVRDVADLHLRAMVDPAAVSERFLAVAGPAVSFHQIAMILREGLGASARRAPRFELPDFAVRLLARFMPAMRGFVPQLGLVRQGDASKAQTLLGWQSRAPREAVLATAESLLSLGLVRDSKKNAAKAKDD